MGGLEEGNKGRTVTKNLKKINVTSGHCRHVVRAPFCSSLEDTTLVHLCLHKEVSLGSILFCPLLF